MRLYRHPIFPSSYAGQVEIYMSDAWSTVTGSWTVANTEVVCHQLGYDLNSKYSVDTHVDQHLLCS